MRSSVWSPPGCHPVGCGIKVYVDKNGKLDHIEGDENDPITQGRLCPRCLAMKDYVYNPHRVVYPMKRPHDKIGDADAWERCSWDEALDLIMDKWDEITGKYGRKTMAIHVGTGRDGMLSQDFQLSIFRTPNLAYTQSGYACYQPRMMASQMVLGVLYPELDYAGGLEGGYDDPQYQVPELMVIWGKAPLESNPDGFFGHSIIDLMKRGARLFIRRPARQLAEQPLRAAAARAQRHGRRPCHGLLQHHHQRGPLRRTTSSRSGPTASTSSRSASAS